MVELFDPVVRQVDSFAGERVSMRVRQLDEGKNYNSHDLCHCNSHFFFLFLFCFFFFWVCGVLGMTGWFGVLWWAQYSWYIQSQETLCVSFEPSIGLFNFLSKTDQEPHFFNICKCNKVVDVRICVPDLWDMQQLHLLWQYLREAQSLGFGFRRRYVQGMSNLQT